jgi:hypothetical protein
MTAHIREGSSVQVVVDVVDGTTAALETDPDTASLAPPWTVMRDGADSLAANGRQLDRNTLRARSVLHVLDTQWDATVAAFGRAVVDASGGRRDQSTYMRFFAKTTPSAAQDLGIPKEIELAPNRA